MRKGRTHNLSSRNSHLSRIYEASTRLAFVRQDSGNFLIGQLVEAKSLRAWAYVFESDAVMLGGLALGSEFSKRYACAHLGVSVASSRTQFELRYRSQEPEEKSAPQTCLSNQVLGLKTKESFRNAYRRRSTDWSSRHNAILCHGR